MDRPRQTETMQRGFYEAVLAATQNAEAATATELLARAQLWSRQLLHGSVTVLSRARLAPRRQSIRG